MEEALARLEAWLAENAPTLRELLRPPAAAAKIAGFEARTSLGGSPGVAPAVHHPRRGGDGSDGILGCQRWLPPRAVAGEIELIGSEGIVPFFRSGGGDLLYFRSYSTAGVPVAWVPG